MTKKSAASRHAASSPETKQLRERSRAPASGLRQDLDERDEMLMTLLSNVPGMVYRRRNDGDGTMEFVSDGCLALTGYAPSDFTGKPLRAYADIIHADDRARVREEVQAALAARQPFQVVYRIVTAGGEEKWVWEQGRGLCSPGGELLSVEGFVANITRLKKTEEQLRESEARFRGLFNLSSDWYWELDADYRFTRFEGRYIEYYGSEYKRYIGKRPTEAGLWMDGVPQIASKNEEAHAKLVENHKAFYNVTMYSVAEDGQRFYMSTSGEPRFDSAGRFIGYRGITRNTTKSKLAERSMLRLSRMYAALSATNAAILRVQSPEGLFQRVCDAAVHGGDFIATAVILFDSGSEWVRVAAGTGIGVETLQKTRISTNEARPEGRGTVGTAFRTRRPAICNDYASDPRMQTWRKEGVAFGIGAAAAIPLFQREQVIGVLLFYSRERNAFDEEIVGLLISMAENVSFALDNFEREKERRAAEQALRDSEARFKSLAELSSDWYWEQDEEFRFTRFDGRYVMRARAAFERLLGNRPWEGISQADESNDWEETHRPLLERREPFRDAVLHTTLPDGKRVWMSISGEPVFDAQGNFKGYRGTGRDITRRVRAEADMRKLSSAIEQTADSVIITDCDGVIEYVNAAFERTTGYAAPEAIGQKPNLIKSSLQDANFYGKVWQTILAGETFSDVFINRKKNGDLYYEEKTISPLRDAQGQITHFISTGKDITERMQAQERLQHIAHHDALTGLPNRVLFLDRLEQALIRAHWQDRVVGVMFLDLDRFKNVNDTLGHDVGDALLKAMAARLQGCVREGDSVARLGGDEFAVLLEDVAHAEDISAIAGKILGAFALPFAIHSHELFITASIGISLYPTDGDSAATLLKNADAAMYRAKDLGKNNYQFYSADMSAAAFERLTLESSLRRALEREEFVLHYQPQIDVARGRLIGVEALLRWQHPEFGLLSPAQFVAIAEETGAIVPLGAWVARKALAQIKRWRDTGHEHLRVAINVSGRQFNEPNFVDTIEQALQETGLPADALELEITESVIMRNAEKTIERLRALHAMGVRFAVDDFGTGYSSLSYLRRFSIHTLKIDKSFIRDIAADSGDVEIVKTIIMMARGLKLAVIAEGVETREQLVFLKSHGCTAVQGYLIARPLTAERLTERLQQSETRPWL